jgi:pSer/pThr/pTyr-binding forkhead associated (FHA) protein
MPRAEVASFAAMPKLTVSLPDGSESVHELNDDQITVGRVDDNMIVIADISVSSHHAELILKDDDYILRDIGSTNGTRCNGRDVPEGQDTPLQDGDSVLFGKVSTLYSSDKAAARPLPEESEVAAVPAASSVRPADFANASPFQTKKEKKEASAVAIMAFAGVALLAFVGAVAMVFGMKSPL